MLMVFCGGDNSCSAVYPSKTALVEQNIPQQTAEKNNHINFYKEYDRRDKKELPHGVQRHSAMMCSGLAVV